MRILELDEEHFTSYVCEKYIRFREEVVRRQKQKRIFLSHPEIYELATKSCREKGYDYTKALLFAYNPLYFPLATSRVYFVYNTKSEELVGMSNIQPAGGDDQQKTWVELYSSFLILDDLIQTSVKKLLLECEKLFLSSHKRSHGIPVARIVTQTEPGNFLFDTLLEIGYQIFTTTHTFQILISRLYDKLSKSEKLEILIGGIDDLEINQGLESRLQEMVDRLYEFEQKIEGREIKQTMDKEQVIKSLKRIREDEDTILAGGKFLGFMDPNDPVPIGYAILYRLEKGQLVFSRFDVIGPQRAKRVGGILQGINMMLGLEASQDIEFIIKTSARDTELTSILENLGFSLSQVVYDLAKDGPDMDKIVFDSYSRDIFEI